MRRCQTTGGEQPAPIQRVPIVPARGAVTTKNAVKIGVGEFLALVDVVEPDAAEPKTVGGFFRLGIAGGSRPAAADGPGPGRAARGIVLGGGRGLIRWRGRLFRGSGRILLLPARDLGAAG